MSSDIASHVFEPFFTTKPLGEGTGLGLSMIYGFARQSGGQISVQSEIGQGTSMSLYLPASSDPPERSNLNAQAHSPQAIGTGEVVLVIDDEATIRMLVADALHDAGYSVIEAWDGPSGLRLLESQPRVDLLITDVGLPGGMNGRQVADAARTLRPDLKILFITGYANATSLRSGQLGEGMQIVPKPFELNVLTQKVRDLIAG